MRVKLGRTPTRERQPRDTPMREVVERTQCGELLRMILAINGRPPSGARLMVLASRGMRYSVVYEYDVCNTAHLVWVADVASSYPEYWDAHARQALRPFESCLS